MYLQCGGCGKIRSVINPSYVKHYIKNKEAENAQRLADNNKAPDPGWRADHILKEHLRKGLDNYEGDFRKDFVQPTLADGSRNPEFERLYGDEIYKGEKSALRQ